MQAQKKTYTLSGGSNYSVISTNPDAVSASVSGNELTIEAKAVGLAHIAISDPAGAQCSFGVVANSADGAPPAMPSHLAVGAISFITQLSQNFWDKLNDQINKRIDMQYTYLYGGPYYNGWLGGNPK